LKRRVGDAWGKVQNFSVDGCVGFSTRSLKRPGECERVLFFSMHLRIEKIWGRIGLTSALPIALNAGWLVTDLGHLALSQHPLAPPAIIYIVRSKLAAGSRH
jgi:hypothetical protein